MRKRSRVKERSMRDLLHLPADHAGAAAHAATNIKGEGQEGGSGGPEAGPARSQRLRQKLHAGLQFVGVAAAQGPTVCARVDVGGRQVLLGPYESDVEAAAMHDKVGGTCARQLGCTGTARRGKHCDTACDTCLCQMLLPLDEGGPLPCTVSARCCFLWMRAGHCRALRTPCGPHVLQHVGFPSVRPCCMRRLGLRSR